MRNAEQIIGNGPEVLLGSHPVDAVKAAEIYGLRVGAQCLFTIWVVIVLEVGHGQFAQTAIDRLPEGGTGIVGLGGRAPTTALAEDCQPVIIVADSFEIEKQRLPSLNTQCCRAEQRALQALSQAVAEHTARTAASRAVFFLVVI